MDSEYFNIDSFLSNTSLIEKSDIDYNYELHEIKENNYKEYEQLKENLNLVNEIIIELEEKANKIEKELNYIEQVHDISIKLFAELSQKNIKV